MKEKVLIQGGYVGAPDAIYTPPDDDAADIVTIFKNQSEVIVLQAEDVIRIGNAIHELRNPHLRNRVCPKCDSRAYRPLDGGDRECLECSRIY